MRLVFVTAMVAVVVAVVVAHRGYYDTLVYSELAVQRCCYNLLLKGGGGGSSVQYVFRLSDYTYFPTLGVIHVNE